MELSASFKEQIHVIRNQKVMLDKDLAQLYGMETKVLKQAVRRNIDRFPEDFMFELTSEEYHFLRSQFVTLKKGQGKHSKYLPFAFTEQGVAMLSSVLNSPKAIEVNIQIMRTFVHMRRYALSHDEVMQNLERLEQKFNQKFRDVHQAIDYLLKNNQDQTNNKKRRKLGY